MKKLFFILSAPLLFLSFSSFMPKGKLMLKANRSVTDSIYYIEVDKSDYELKVFDEEGWYATYPVVFGSKDIGDKMFEGDKRTPNGSYTIILKTISKKWGPELLLDYPTAENKVLFNKRKAEGKIPSKAKIGNGIAIHGTRPDEEWTIDYEVNWTDGCISVRYTDMLDLYSYIGVGIKVLIRP